MKEKEIAFEDLIQVKPQIFLLSKRSRKRPILRVKFSGAYANGGSGGPDASFMLNVLERGFRKFGPRAIILDLTELNYQWGDEMVWLLPREDGMLPGSRRTPMVVVTGPDCEEAIRTLAFGIDSEKQLDSVSWARRSVEEAIGYLDPMRIRVR